MSPINDEIVIVKANELIKELEKQVREYETARDTLTNASQSTDSLKKEYVTSKKMLDKSIKLAGSSFSEIQGLVAQFQELKGSVENLESAYKQTYIELKKAQSQIRDENHKVLRSSEQVTQKIESGIERSVASGLANMGEAFKAKEGEDSKEILASLNRMASVINESFQMLNRIGAAQVKSNPSNEIGKIVNVIGGLREEIGNSQELLNRNYESSSNITRKSKGSTFTFGILKYVFVPVAVSYFLLLQLAPLKKAISQIKLETRSIKSNQHSVIQTLESMQEIEQKRVVINQDRIQILNGCGIPLVADKLAKQLINRGYQVGKTENADNFTYTETIIITNSRNFSDGVKLALLLGIDTNNVSVDDTRVSNFKFTVIIGADYQLISINS